METAYCAHCRRHRPRACFDRVPCGKRSRSCVDCDGKAGRPPDPPDPDGPGPYKANAVERHEAARRRRAEDEIRPLIRRYEATRALPGRDRDGATRRLEHALARHEGAVACDGRVYLWSRADDSIRRMRAASPVVPGRHRARVAPRPEPAEGGGA